MHRAAMEELAWGWKNALDSPAIHKERARSDEDGLVRHYALREFAEAWRDDLERWPPRNAP